MPKSQSRERQNLQDGTSSSVTRAFAILDLISLQGEGGATLMELTKKLRMSKSTAHRYLITLEKLGAIERNATARFTLGLKLIQLAGRTLSNSDLRKQAEPFLHELSAVTHETVHLAIPSGIQVTYIAKADSAHSIRMYSHIGAQAPMYCTALGKAILAYADSHLCDEVIHAGLTARTPNAITSRQGLLSELERVRADGFAIDHQENELGVCCVGAPIFDYSASPIGAMSISGPADRMNRTRQLALGPLVKDAALRLSRRMGYPL